MDKEEIVTLLEDVSDTLSEMGTSISENDLMGLSNALRAVLSDLQQVTEYLTQQNADEEEDISHD